MTGSEGDRAAGGETDADGPGAGAGTLNAKGEADATLTGPAFASSPADDVEAAGDCVGECDVQGVLGEYE